MRRGITLPEAARCALVSENEQTFDGCWNLSPRVPADWETDRVGTFNESFTAETSFSLSLYSINEAFLTREQLRHTVENALAVDGGQGTIISFIALDSDLY